MEIRIEKTLQLQESVYLCPSRKVSMYVCAIIALALVNSHDAVDVHSPWTHLLKRCYSSSSLQIQLTDLHAHMSCKSKAL